MDIRENRSRLHQINKVYTNFLDNICLTQVEFRNCLYNVNKVLQNKNYFFSYDKTRITQENINAYELVYEKYCNIIKSIFELNLKKTQILNLKPAIELSNTDKFDIFSPKYIIDTYASICENNDNQTVYMKMTADLEKKYKKVKKYYKLFNKKYYSLINKFILNCPENLELMYNYQTTFLNNLLKVVIDFCNYMIDINVYAVPLLINNVVTLYTPMDTLHQIDVIVL